MKDLECSYNLGEYIYAYTKHLLKGTKNTM